MQVLHPESFDSFLVSLTKGFLQWLVLTLALLGSIVVLIMMSRLISHIDFSKALAPISQDRSPQLSETSIGQPPLDQKSTLGIIVAPTLIESTTLP